MKHTYTYSHCTAHGSSVVIVIIKKKPKKTIESLNAYNRKNYFNSAAYGDLKNAAQAQDRASMSINN
jgi:hypothetical protein